MSKFSEFNLRVKQSKDGAPADAGLDVAGIPILPSKNEFSNSRFRLNWHSYSTVHARRDAGIACLTCMQMEIASTS